MAMAARGSLWSVEASGAVVSPPSWNLMPDGSRRRVVYVLSAMMTSALARPDGKATGDPWFAWTAWTSAHFTRLEAGAKRFLAQTRYFAARQRCSTMWVTTVTDRASGTA